MSDNEDSSDGMDELHDIIAEYEAKEKQAKQENTATTSAAGSKVKVEKADIKSKRSEQEGSDIEVPMEKSVFGDKAGLIKRLAKAVKTTKTKKNKEESGDEDETNAGEKGKKRPAWTDADDEVILGDVKRPYKGEYTAHLRMDKSYKDYLTTKFTRLQPQPKWATLEKPKTEYDSDDDELLRTVGFLAKPAEGVLAPHQIQIKTLKDLNRATYAEGNISSIEFHPTSMAALVTGTSGIASIYGIDGRENEKLHNMFFKRFPIKRARIMPCGTKAIFGSIRHYYYKYDLLTAKQQCYNLPKNIVSLEHFELSPCGQYMAVAGLSGDMHLFHAKTLELINTFKQDDTVTDLCFTGDSQRIICNSDSNTVNIFSLRKQRLEHKFIDDGCIKGSSIALAPNQRLLATGSMEGVVNVYDFDKVQQTNVPQPEKIFLNLTTGISQVKFNHSSELLAFCSDLVPNAVKIAHFPSGTVYANFPVQNSNQYPVNVLKVSFSPNSGYLALGTYKKVPFYRLKHFQSY